MPFGTLLLGKKRGDPHGSDPSGRRRTAEETAVDDAVIKNAVATLLPASFSRRKAIHRLIFVNQVFFLCMHSKTIPANIPANIPARDTDFFMITTAVTRKQQSSKYLYGEVNRFAWMIKNIYFLSLCRLFFCFHMKVEGFRHIYGIYTLIFFVTGRQYRYNLLPNVPSIYAGTPVSETLNTFYNVIIARQFL
jgi:hypothetical protein